MTKCSVKKYVDRCREVGIQDQDREGGCTFTMIKYRTKKSFSSSYSYIRLAFQAVQYLYTLPTLLPSHARAYEPFNNTSGVPLTHPPVSSAGGCIRSASLTAPSVDPLGPSIAFIKLTLESGARAFVSVLVFMLCLIYPSCRQNVSKVTNRLGFSEGPTDVPYSDSGGRSGRAGRLLP